jgi:hypothetical protein
MKRKSLVFIIVALISISLALPATSHARGGWRGGWGWYGAGALAGGVLLGAALAQPWYYPPPPVYVYRQPSVIYAVPPVYYSNQAYAYPDPAVSSQSGGNPPSGQWVEVPAQSVNGTWVPSHKVWVPNSP